MVALPLGKLGILAVKQIAKPIAKGLKQGALQSNFFKSYVIMPVAQGVNWVEVKVKTSLMGAKKAKVYKLNEKVAVEYGAELISELFIYTLGTVILIYEYTRSVAKEEKKELRIQEETNKIKGDVEQLKKTVLESEFIAEERAAEIRSLHRQIGDLHNQISALKPDNNSS